MRCEKVPTPNASGLYPPIQTDRAKYLNRLSVFEQIGLLRKWELSAADQNRTTNTANALLEPNRNWIIH